MAKLIRTNENILIEIEAEPGEYQPCSAGDVDKVEKGLEQIGPLLDKACEAVKDVWKKQVEGVVVEQVQIEFGLNFEAEGNAYIARAKAGASVSVTVTLKKPA